MSSLVLHDWFDNDKFRFLCMYCDRLIDPNKTPVDRESTSPFHIDCAEKWLHSAPFEFPWVGKGHFAKKEITVQKTEKLAQEQLKATKILEELTKKGSSKSNSSKAVLSDNFNRLLWDTIS